MNHSLLLLAVFVGAATAGCLFQGVQVPLCATVSADPVASYTACKIDMGDFKFYPDEVFIQTGTTVTWFNGDDAEHSVYTVSGVEQLASGPFAKGASWAYFFNNSGEVVYASRHPASLPLGAMRGKIVVLPRP